MNHSYIVLDKATDKAVTELFSKALADRVNTKKYYVMTAYGYLCRLNKQIKENTWAYHLSTRTWPSITESMLTAPPWSLLLGGVGSYRSVEKHILKSTWWKISKQSLSNTIVTVLLRLARLVTLHYNSVRMKENTANNINMTTNPEHLETLDEPSLQTLIDHYLRVREKLPDNLRVRDRLIELQDELLNRQLNNEEWWQC